MKKRIVWKLAGGSCYLVDFSQEVATAQGPVDTLNHPVVLEVLCDQHSWLIIDGRQQVGLEYACSMLLACSAKKESHHEFRKDNRSQIRYLPVWTEDEIGSFCDAFEKHRFEFPTMNVPDKNTALANFRELGGIARFVLVAGKMKDGRVLKSQAMGNVCTDNCLKVVGGVYSPDWSDMLVHMVVDDKGDYTSYEYVFASADVENSFLEHFSKIGRLTMVSFLEQQIKSGILGTFVGRMYEVAAHGILSGGGEFKRKRVLETGVEVHDTLKQEPLKLVSFQTLQELTKLKDDYPERAYCQPSSLNFESVDAVILPGTLVQYFKYNKGNHGYKVHGLMELDKALNLDNYMLWSCVRRESFEQTKYQNWVTAKGTKYKDMTPKVEGLLQKMQQYVVEVDYRRCSSM